jgi:hypothetical protein
MTQDAQVLTHARREAGVGRGAIDRFDSPAVDWAHLPRAAHQDRGVALKVARDIAD